MTLGKALGTACAAEELIKSKIDARQTPLNLASFHLANSSVRKQSESGSPSDTAAPAAWIGENIFSFRLFHVQNKLI